jgi:hypothetical protein
MSLNNADMYTLEIKDLNGTEVTTVTKPGWELLNEYDFLIVGQTVREWRMFVVTPFGA